jgi:hypothetical protein
MTTLADPARVASIRGAGVRHGLLGATINTVLTPGDQIFLTIPSAAGRAQADVEQDAETYIGAFEALGVTVVHWAASSTLTHLVVGAVVRTPEDKPRPTAYTG